MKKILAYLLIAIGLLGIVLAGSGFYFGSQIIQDASGFALSQVSNLKEHQDWLLDTLSLSSRTLDNTSDIFATLATTLDDSATALDNSETLQTSSKQILVTDVPEALGVVQDAVDSVKITLTGIDDFLTTLNEIEIPIGPFPPITLGIGYAPETPPQADFETLSTSINSISEQLLNLDTSFDTLNSDINTIGQDLRDLAEDFRVLETDILEANTDLESFTQSIQAIQINELELTQQIETLSSTTSLFLCLLCLWFGIFQILPLHYGWQLIKQD